MDGGAEGDRTPDLYNAIVALSQLSYGPDPLVAGLVFPANLPLSPACWGDLERCL